MVSKLDALLELYGAAYRETSIVAPPGMPDGHRYAVAGRKPAPPRPARAPVLELTS